MFLFSLKCCVKEEIRLTKTYFLNSKMHFLYFLKRCMHATHACKCKHSTAIMHLKECQSQFYLPSLLPKMPLLLILCTDFNLLEIASSSGKGGYTKKQALALLYVKFYYLFITKGLLSHYYLVLLYFLWKIRTHAYCLMCKKMHALPCVIFICTLHFIINLGEYSLLATMHATPERWECQIEVYHEKVFYQEKDDDSWWWYVRCICESKSHSRTANRFKNSPLLLFYHVFIAYMFSFHNTKESKWNLMFIFCATSH